MEDNLEQVAPPAVVEQSEQEDNLEQVAGAAVVEPEPGEDSQIKKLRNEAANYRVKARETSERLTARETALFDALVKLDGRLADSRDVEFNAEYLEEPDRLSAAISDILEAKPGLAARRYGGNIGAGVQAEKDVSLVEIMKSM